MATLNVTNLKNVGAGVTNVSLLADGTTTLVLNATGASRTGGMRYNGGVLEVYDGANWVAAGIASLTTTAPIVSSGGATPVISATLATAAQAAAGTSNVVLMTPEFAVPKDAAGMTGAAILPSGTTGQQPGTLVTGMTRYNTSTGDLEFYTGSAWSGATAKVPGAGTTYDGGAIVTPSGTTAQRPGTPAGGMFRYNTDLNPDSMEFYDSTQSAWIALATLPQLQGVAIDVYSNFSAGSGGGAFTDTPVGPATTIRNSVTVPAGYTNFIIYSTVAFSYNYNTTTGSPSCFNVIQQNSTGLGYQAVVATIASDVNGIQLSSNVFVSGTSAVGTANTFDQHISKNQPFGPIQPLDSSLVVLAWTI